MTTEKNDIGGWASVIIKQDNEATNAANRHDALFHRLGRGFYGACNPALHIGEQKAQLDACKLLVKEIRRVLDLDSKHQALWELAYLSEAQKCGVDLDLIDEMAAGAGMRDKLRVDPVFAKKVEEWALCEGTKK